MKSGTAIAAVNVPAEHARLLAGGATIGRAGTVIVYVRDAAEARAHVAKVKTMLLPDARLWVAYPKAKKFGTDLNRGTLCDLLAEHDFQPVRQIAIDETWSAMWFRRVPLG